MEVFKRMIISIVLVLGIISCDAQKPAVKNQDEALVVDETKSVEIGGEKFHYIKKDSGAPTIFIHGTTGDYRTWLSHVETYSKQFHATANRRRYAYPNNQFYGDTSAGKSVRFFQLKNNLKRSCNDYALAPTPSIVLHNQKH